MSAAQNEHPELGKPEGEQAEAPPAKFDWDAIMAEEERRIDRRRTWLATRDWPIPIPPNRVALAFSGGGIRSATFALGVLRALSRLRLLPLVDYLSTVSGGGYAGSFYCSLYVPHPMRGTIHEAASERAEEWAHKRADSLLRADRPGDVFGSHIGKAALEQLREGGHFLNPNGTSDALFAAVIALRNWLAVALVTGLMLITLFLALNIPRLGDIAPIRNSTTWTASVPMERPRPIAVGTARAQASGVHVVCAAEAAEANGAASAKCTISPRAERPKSRAAPPNLGRGRLGASWLWLLAGLLLPLWVFPAAWAYWLTRTENIPERRWERLASIPALVALAFAVLLGSLLAMDPGLSIAQWLAGATVAISAVGAIGLYALAEWRVAQDGRRSKVGTVTEAALRAEENRVRTKLSRWLFRGVFCAMIAAGVAAADDAGRAVYHMMTLDGVAYPRLNLATGALGATAALIVPIGRWFLKRAQSSNLLSWPRLGPIVRRFGRWIALAAGLVLLLAVFIFWSALAYVIFWHGAPVAVDKPFAAWPAWWGRPWLPPVLITLFAAACTILIGRVHGFLNQSSLASFYAARLRKAYLGASNLDRIQSRTSVDIELPNDEVTLAAYYHPALLAPVHLINATINETTSESSRVIQRDRKGKGLTISPGGYSFVSGAPTQKPDGFPLDQGEQLPLSAWMGISGAAFSTGMGQHTSLGLSLLAGMTNLRLGYWWDSPQAGRTRTEHGPVSSPMRWWRRVKDSFGDLVQSYLIREIRDDFEGTHSNRWYLSDGGHFENMGLYELIRRRVPVIIACDNGADPLYDFSDFVNLVRKIRIDLGAETELVGKEELDTLFGQDTTLRRAFGTLEEIATEIREDGPGAAGPYASLARIKFIENLGNPDEFLTLLLIKPRISGAELLDLIRYKKTNVAFPQQPTTDLFFDETQWESYFRLGQLIAETIFTQEESKDRPPVWRPWELRPLPRR